MSKEKVEEGTGAGAVATRVATPFTIAKVDGRYKRLQDVEATPEGALAVTSESVVGMTMVEISEIYSEVAGVSPKRFKDKRVAIESLAYQVAKMPIFDPSAPKPAPIEKGAKAAKTAVVGEKKLARKASETLELLQPEKLDEVLRALAPQARELVAIMADLAKEKNAATFSGTDLDSFLKIPEVGARLRTKQDPARILAYYKGKLIAAGLVRVS